MSELKRFSLPLKGLKDGIHTFDFQVDSSFFNKFEGSPIKEGNFDVELFFDKRPDMIVMTFQIAGKFKTACDRCLTSINLPVKDSHQLLVKYAEQASEEAEVIYLPIGSPELNVAKYVYEYICLSMPLVKIYDCQAEEVPPCDSEMLKHLNADAKAEESTDEAPPTENPIWDALKKFKGN